MKMDIHHAWAAGFFDGEGSTFISKQKRGKVFRTQIRISITQQWCNREVLERFKAIVGVGEIYFAQSRHCHVYQAYTFEQVQAIIATLWKYLSSQKKAQARLALISYLELQRCR